MDYIYKLICEDARRCALAKCGKLVKDVWISELNCSGDTSFTVMIKIGFVREKIYRISFQSLEGFNQTDINITIPHLRNYLDSELKSVQYDDSHFENVKDVDHGRLIYIFQKENEEASKELGVVVKYRDPKNFEEHVGILLAENKFIADLDKTIYGWSFYYPNIDAVTEILKIKEDNHVRTSSTI